MPRVEEKEKAEKNKKLVSLALAAFAICIVVFAVVGAFVMDSFSNLQQVEDNPAIEEDTYKGEIDDRLRFIAMQDDDAINAKKHEDEDFERERFDSNNEPDEIAAFLENEDVKKNKFEEYNEKHMKKEVQKSVPDSNIDLSDIPYKKDVPISNTNKSLKVVIGHFQTKEAAQEELLSVRSQFSATPFVRLVNGYYTIQVGSFKTQSTANEFLNSLKNQGYSARIIEE